MQPYIAQIFANQQTVLLIKTIQFRDRYPSGKEVAANFPGRGGFAQASAVIGRRCHGNNPAAVFSDHATEPAQGAVRRQRFYLHPIQLPAITQHSAGLFNKIVFHFFIPHTTGYSVWIKSKCISMYRGNEVTLNLTKLKKISHTLSCRL